MGADSRRTRSQESQSSLEKGDAGWGPLVLCAVLGITGCKIGSSVSDPNGGDGGGPDGGKKDARSSEVSGASDATAQPKTCAPDAPGKSKGKAESCGCDRDCQTGFCVSGICCTSACAERCKACNLPSALGDCAFVPPGVKPTDPLACAATTPATCGQDGTCDGKGGCRQYPKGTECKSGTCEGDGINGILTCDGNGKCSEAISQTCPPYSCDSTTSRCATACTTNVECAASQQCVANRCGKSANGAVCQTADDCSSGFCADGVCCNVACSGVCVSCSQTGLLGHCAFVPAGLPDPACNASDRTTCGNTGLCDGLGSCTLYPEQTVCGASSCSGLVETVPRTCDGQGTCREAQLVDCSPFLCTNGACVQDCKSDADCEAGHLCVQQTWNGVTSGTCGKRKNGQPCPDSSECESGACVDGVCCESSCTGPCRSCSLPGSPGQCLNVASGAPDPRKTCTDLGATSCSTNGVCDGAGACQYYPAGTECSPQSCVAGAYSPPSTCSAFGQCVASPSRTCSPFLCNGSACYDICVSDKQCVTGNFCQNSSCGLKPRGANCSVGADCVSGFCAQGVCCDSRCTDACMACNLNVAAGTCTAVADNAPDPQGICVVTPANTCGTTGNCAKGACVYYAKGSQCQAAACAGTSSVAPASTCDSLGACSTPASQPCGSFVCASGACKTTCTKDTDCVAPDTCVNNSCGLKVSGAACTSASQCQSGFCTEGVCCNSACADAASGGLCKTCRGTGTSRVGTCSNVDSGASDPKSRCVKSDASTGDCSNDGTCNGSGACRPSSSSAGCRQEGCVGGTHTFPANCDGKGACPAASTASCGSYVCSATSPTCLNTCESDHDCANSLTCLQTNNRCGGKLGAGETCQADSDCSTGLVCSSEKVCCDHTCPGACQSCKVSGRAGTCSNTASGSTPRDNTCSAAATGVCGNTGKCNSGGCELRTSCSPKITTCPSDAHSQYAATGTCGAGGSCVTTTQPCGSGYLCVSGATCAASCTTANAATNCDTAAGYSCLSNFCQKSPKGATCTNSNQCSTNNCVDGYCCDTACDALCYACNVGTSPGICSPVPNNGADTSSAHGTCVAACQGTQVSGLCDGAGSCKGMSPCQTGFVCANNACAPTCTVVPCAALDQCHVAGTCDHATGVCSNPNKADGTGCDDGNACTRIDLCQAGTCVGGNPVTCTASDQCHVAGTCDPTSGACSNPPKGDGSTCNDGNACTRTDTCQAGICTGSNPVTCTASDQCHVAGTCDPANGACSNPAKGDGSTCNDGNACTRTDTCQAGACTGSNPVTCTASDQCHVAGTCDPASGTCSNPPKADGSTCNDGNACTSSDTCQAGTCTGADPVTCTASDQCHVAGTCDPANGTCSNPTKTDGSPCNDGSACTRSDTCQAGSCTGADPVTCTALDQCHDVGTCDPATGVCSNPNKADRTGCDDGVACTTGDVCTAGTCAGTSVCGAALTCNLQTGLCG